MSGRSRALVDYGRLMDFIECANPLCRRFFLPLDARERCCSNLCIVSLNRFERNPARLAEMKVRARFADRLHFPDDRAQIVAWAKDHFE